MWRDWEMWNCLSCVCVFQSVINEQHSCPQSNIPLVPVPSSSLRVRQSQRWPKSHFIKLCLSEDLNQQSNYHKNKAEQTCFMLQRKWGYNEWLFFFFHLTFLCSVQDLTKQLDEVTQNSEIVEIRQKEAECELEAARDRVQQQATEILLKASKTVEKQRALMPDS